MRRSYRRRSSGRPLRGMDWGNQYTTAGGNGIQIGPSGASYSWLLDPITASSEYVDPTIMAVRFSWLLMGPAAAYASGGQVVAGIMTFTSPNGALPTGFGVGPASSAYLDWMLRSVSWLPQNGNANLAVFFHNENPQNCYTKAKRRLGNGKGLLLVIENLTGQTIQARYDCRYLLKE